MLLNIPRVTGCKNTTTGIVCIERTDRPMLTDMNIRKICPCDVYPLKPHFYVEKLGYAGVYLFFFFLLQNIDCGYSARWF